MQTNITKLGAFEVFKIAPNFNINKAQLEANLLQLQQQYHPDKVLKQQDIFFASLASAHINTCYGILVNDTQRAAYLTKLWLEVDMQNNEHRLSLNAYPDVLEAIFNIEELFESSAESAIAKAKTLRLNALQILQTNLTSKQAAINARDKVLKAVQILKYTDGKV